MSSNDYFQNKLVDILVPMSNALLTACPDDPVNLFSFILSFHLEIFYGTMA